MPIIRPILLLIPMLMLQESNSLVSCGSQQLAIGFDLIQGQFRNQDFGIVINESPEIKSMHSAVMLIRDQFLKSHFAIAIGNHQNQSFVSDLSFLSCGTTLSDIENLVQFANKLKLGRMNPFLIIHDNVTNISTLTKIAMSITANMQVYFVNTKEGSILEAYSVNNFAIVRTIGNFSTYENKVTSLTGPNPLTTFVKRRSNLMGQHIRVMFHGHKAYGPVVSNYQDIASFDNVTQTFDVTSLASGMYPEYLAQVAKSLNFSYSLHQRLDRQTGSDIDGKPTGMIASLFYGEAELIAYPLGINTVRQKYVDYLPIIGTDYYTLVISSTLKNQDYSWTTYTKPFAVDLWCALVLVALVIGTWLHWTNFNHKYCSSKLTEFFLSLVSWIWVGMSANFSGKPKNPLPNNSASNKIVLFTTLLVGTVIWMGYRASITSELSVVRTKYPFNSLDTFLGSDYKLLTTSLGSYSADSFTKAKKGSLLANIFDQHMDLESSFAYSSKGLDKIVGSSEKLAGYYGVQDVLKHGKYDCQVDYVYKDEKPTSKFGFAIRKGSPYYQFLAYEVTKLISQGHVQLMESRYLKKIPNCNPILTEVRPMTVQKIFTLFLMLCIGIVTASLLLMFEMVLRPSKEDLLEDTKLPKEVEMYFTLLNTALLSNRHNKRIFQRPMDNLKSLLEFYRN